MNNNLLTLKHTMEEVDRTWDFTPLVNKFSPNVIFEATVPEGTPISGKFIGKKAVTKYFMETLPSTAIFKQKKDMEFIAHENRVIILGDDEYTLKADGKTYRSPYAMTVTFHDELISRILIIQDLSGLYESYKKHSD